MKRVLDFLNSLKELDFSEIKNIFLGHFHVHKFADSGTTWHTVWNTGSGVDGHQSVPLLIDVVSSESYYDGHEKDLSNIYCSSLLVSVTSCAMK